MKLLYKDQLRKIKFNLFNFISLSLLVILISLTFTAVKQSLSRLEDNYEVYLEEQQVETFNFSMSSVDITYLSGTETVYLCEQLDIEFECYYNISLGTRAAYNNLNHLINEIIDDNPALLSEVADDYVENIKQEYGFIIEKKNISDVVDGNNKYRFMSITEQVDIPYVFEGELPDEDFEITVFPEFAEHNDIELNDTLTINNVDYTVTAFAYSSDHIFPIYFMNVMELEKDTIILTTINTVEQLDSSIKRKYVAIGDLKDILDVKTLKEVNETDTSVLGKHTQIRSIKPAIGNYAISSLPFEVENGTIFMNVFLTTFISFVILLLLIFLKRYIDKNKKDIEILRAIGYSNYEITKSLMLFPLIISLMSIIGFLLGLITSNSLFELYSGRYLFPKAEFQIYLSVVITAVVIPIIAINLISFLFIKLSLRIDKKKSPRFHYRLFKFTSLKTVLSSSLLITTVSIMIIFGTNGNSMFNSFGTHTKLGNNYYESIRLDYFTDDVLNDDYEKYIRVGGRITTINANELEKHYGIRVYGIEPTNNLKLLINNDPEKNLLLNQGVIISEYTEFSLGLKVGDVITLSVSEQDREYEVVGVSNELIENSIYLDKQELEDIYDLDDTFYNGVYTTNNEYQSNQIIQRIDYNKGLDNVIQTLTTSSIIVNFVLVLSIFLSLFAFVFILINYLSDNRINIAVLKSIGYSNYEINQRYLLSVFIIFLLSYGIAIPLTYILFDMLLSAIIHQVGYILIIDISVVYLLLGFIVLMVVFFTTVYFVNKYYEKISISDMLKTDRN